MAAFGRIPVIPRSSSLRSVARGIDTIQTEIDAREQLVEKLRADAEIYQQLVDLNRPQVEAIVSLLQHVVDVSSAGSNRRTTRTTIISVSVGFVGAALVA